MRTEVIGNATLHLGDCREMALQADVLVTDPPYGNGMRFKGVNRDNINSSLDFKRTGTRQPDWDDIHGNDRPFDPLPWVTFPEAIIWGANHYAGLPVARGWLIWDKRRDTTPDDHGDAELAWTNLDQVIRIHRQVWRGIVREGSENVANGPKLHPTQKPIELMRWCMGMTKGETVLDPFMGSGSTGVAAIEQGRKFIGVEIAPKYFEIACSRLDQAQRQQRLSLTVDGARP